MKDFKRQNPLFSLCGLNCGLCPMFLGKYCGGCGHGSQSCAIARCAAAQGNVEYCFQCPQYPCEKYDHIDDFDSFITHRRQKSDLKRAQSIGIAQYNLEQEEKVRILNELLCHYNDGRKKTLFCTAVNLLELPALRRQSAGFRLTNSLTQCRFGKKAPMLRRSFRKSPAKAG
jgi:hypothetical protein